MLVTRNTNVDNGLAGTALENGENWTHTSSDKYSNPRTAVWGREKKNLNKTLKSISRVTPTSQAVLNSATFPALLTR